MTQASESHPHRAFTPQEGSRTSPELCLPTRQGLEPLLRQPKLQAPTQPLPQAASTGQGWVGRCRSFFSLEKADQLGASPGLLSGILENGCPAGDGEGALWRGLGPPLPTSSLPLPAMRACLCVWGGGGARWGGGSLKVPACSRFRVGWAARGTSPRRQGVERARRVLTAGRWPCAREPGLGVRDARGVSPALQIQTPTRTHPPPHLPCAAAAYPWDPHPEGCTHRRPRRARARARFRPARLPWSELARAPSAAAAPG